MRDPLPVRLIVVLNHSFHRKLTPNELRALMEIAENVRCLSVIAHGALFHCGHAT